MSGTFELTASGRRILYLDKLFLDSPDVISDPCSLSGASTISSVVLEANPAEFFATHV
jgi:hypothetical protein